MRGGGGGADGAAGRRGDQIGVPRRPNFRVIGDLLDALTDLTPLLRRVLSNEGGFDVEKWEERLRSLLNPVAEEEGKSQSDLFT